MPLLVLRDQGLRLVRFLYGIGAAEEMLKEAEAITAEATEVMFLHCTASSLADMPSRSRF